MDSQQQQAAQPRRCMGTTTALTHDVLRSCSTEGDKTDDKYVCARVCVWCCQGGEDQEA